MLLKAPKKESVRIMIQQRVGGKNVKTSSFCVYAVTHKKVARVIRLAIQAKAKKQSKIN